MPNLKRLSRAVLVSLLWFGLAACSSTAPDSGWIAGLAAVPTGGSSVAGTAYASSTQLAVGWSAASRTVDHYLITAIESMQSTEVVATADGSATTATLEGLKSGTEYSVTLVACLDSSCTGRLDADAAASGTTSEEYWQLQGSASSDSFTAMTTIVPDSNTKAYVIHYGAGAPASLQGKVRLYYDAMTTKGVNVGITSGVSTTDVSSANLFLAIGSSYGLTIPSSSVTLIEATDGISTSQAVPVGGKIRMFFEAKGMDGKTRILSVDSQDGYVGEDFNSGSDTSCSTAADYSIGGGCEPTVVIGVTGDSIATSGLTNARQFKIGYPKLDSWIWDGAAGTFMVITGSSCSSTSQGLAYATSDESGAWSVNASGGCATYLVDNAHGPVLVHLGEVRYKLYYEDSSVSMTDKPFKMIYGDGSVSGSATTVDFADWEASSAARDVHFLWPSGNDLTAADESGLGDHVVYFPTDDPGTQFMYMNLGGLDDSTWNRAPQGIGMAVLVNP